MLNIYLNKKKLYFLSFFLISFFSFFVFQNIAFSASENSNFVLLEDFGNSALGKAGLQKEIEDAINSNSQNAIGIYINIIVKYSIGLLSVAAVIHLIYAGFIYVNSETFFKKTDAKQIILKTLGAILLLFASFVFFKQLNPSILEINFKPISDNQTIDLRRTILGF